MKRNLIMKIFCAVMMAVFSLGILCGCGENTETPEGSQEEPEAEVPSGQCFELQDAYTDGLISREALLSIAYYNNGGRQYNETLLSDSYTPIPKTPETLSEETEKKIEACVAQWNKAGSAEVVITHYYGTYQGAVAFRWDIPSFHAGETQHIDYVDDVSFFDNFYPSSITVWKE